MSDLDDTVNAHIEALREIEDIKKRINIADSILDYVLSSFATPITISKIESYHKAYKEEK